MKANEAPEKIYIFEYELQREDHVVRYGVNQDKGIEGLIEYTRTDAFIEKALRWMISQGGVNDALSKEMIDDFRKYMKGEKV